MSRTERLVNTLIEKFRLQGLSSGTLRNYRSFITKFLKWCEKFNRDPLDEVSFVAHYIHSYYLRDAHEANRRNLYLVVSEFFKLAGKPLSVSKSDIEKLGEEIKRSVSSPPEDPGIIFTSITRELKSGNGEKKSFTFSLPASQKVVVKITVEYQ
jgi:hypothetical protein